MTPTDAQSNVCRAIASGKSVCVLAHAGTGKTSVMLHAVALAPVSKTLFLEYNRSLKDELRHLVEMHDLSSHISAENYDSFLTRWYDRSAPVSDFDLALLRVLKEDTRPLQPVTFDRLVIDEAQDLTFEFVKFVKKMLMDNTVQPSSRVQIVLVGDSRQAINGFRGASAVYLEKASETFQRSFVTLRLPETFRFGQGLCETVNSVVGPLFGESWNGDVVSGCSTRTTEVTLWRNFDEGLPLESDVSRRSPRSLTDTFRMLLRAEEARETVVLLTRSLLDERAQGLWDFVGSLNAADVSPKPVLSEHCSPSDNPRVVISTIHASKGRTFDHCFFVVGGDWGSSRQREPRMDAESMRILYVAMTRAKRHLHIVDDTGIFEQLVLNSNLRERLQRRRVSPHQVGEEEAQTVVERATDGSGDTQTPPRSTSTPRNIATAAVSRSSRDLATVLDKGLKVEARAVMMEWLERQFRDPYSMCGDDDLLLASGDDLTDKDFPDGSSQRVPVVVACAFQLWATRRLGFEAHPVLDLLRESASSPSTLADFYRRRTRQPLPNCLRELLAKTPPLPQTSAEMNSTRAEIFVRLAVLHEIFRFGQVAPPLSGDCAESPDNFDVGEATSQTLELMVRCPPLCLAGKIVTEIPGLTESSAVARRTDDTNETVVRPPRRLGTACPELIVTKSPDQVLLLVAAYDVLPQLRHTVLGLYVASALKIPKFRIHYVGSERHFDFVAPSDGAKCVDDMLRNKRRRTS